MKGWLWFLLQADWEIYFSFFILTCYKIYTVDLRMQPFNSPAIVQYYDTYQSDDAYFV